MGFFVLILGDHVQTRHFKIQTFFQYLNTYVETQQSS